MLWQVLDVPYLSFIQITSSQIWHLVCGGGTQECIDYPFVDSHPTVPYDCAAYEENSACNDGNGYIKFGHNAKSAVSAILIFPVIFAIISKFSNVFDQSVACVVCVYFALHYLCINRKLSF